MMRVRWISVVQALVLSGCLWAAEADSAQDARTARHFKVQWWSVQYDKSVVAENPALSQTRQTRRTSETVTLSCQVEIRDPNLVLGVGREGVITEMTDGAGRQVTVPAPVAQFHQMYGELHYVSRMRAPKMSRWQTIMGYIRRHVPIGLAARRAPQTVGPPQFVTELQPSRIMMRLDKDLLGQPRRELRSVQGYFHALVAESLENIDVPFEPNDTWVRLTPDVEVQVKEAACTPGSYQFWIETRPQGGRGMRPLSVGEPLPGRIVVARQLLGPDGKPDSHPSPPFLPAPVGGRASGSGRNFQIKAIRFVVAVNPTEHKIPFELAHVPLPNPDQQDGSGGE
jgi:hypothetical protein